MSGGGCHQQRPPAFLAAGLAQMLDPPHCLHWLVMRLCSQMPSPLHCLHSLRTRHVLDLLHAAVFKFGLVTLDERTIDSVHRCGVGSVLTRCGLNKNPKLNRKESTRNETHTRTPRHTHTPTIVTGTHQLIDRCFLHLHDLIPCPSLPTIKKLLISTV